MSDALVIKLIAAILGVLITALGGLSVRKRFTEVRSGESHANLQGVKDTLEASLLEKRVEELDEDRNNWRATAEKAWAETDRFRQLLQDEAAKRTAIELRYRNFKSNLGFAVRLIRQHYRDIPELDLLQRLERPSQPGGFQGGLDTLPPKVGKTDFGDLEGG